MTVLDPASSRGEHLYSQHISLPVTSLSLDTASLYSAIYRSLAALYKSSGVLCAELLSRFDISFPTVLPRPALAGAWQAPLLPLGILTQNTPQPPKLSTPLSSVRRLDVEVDRKSGSSSSKWEIFRQLNANLGTLIVSKPISPEWVIISKWSCEYSRRVLGQALSS